MSVYDSLSSTCAPRRFRDTSLISPMTGPTDQEHGEDSKRKADPDRSIWSEAFAMRLQSYPLPQPR